MRSPRSPSCSTNWPRPGQLEGALVTIDAMGCQVEIAAKIVAHKADFLLPLKGNQPTMEAEVAAYFETAPKEELVDKDDGRERPRPHRNPHLHRLQDGRLDRRRQVLSGQAAFRSIGRFFAWSTTPNTPTAARSIRASTSRRAPLDIERLAAGARGHWGVESMHWLLDVEFKDDLSRYRAGHGAKNMAVVRRFALGLVRANKSKGSVKSRRKAAAWNTDFLLAILQMK